MSILNITKLTDTPERWIEDKYDDAFNKIEKELHIVCNDEVRTTYINEQIELLEEHMNDSKGSELLSIIDNFLVNNDYYADVKEIYNN